MRLTASTIHDSVRLMPGNYLHLAWWIWTPGDQTLPSGGGAPPVRETALEPAWYLRVRFTPKP